LWNDYVNAWHDIDWWINLQVIGLTIAENRKKELRRRILYNVKYWFFGSTSNYCLTENRFTNADQKTAVQCCCWNCIQKLSKKNIWNLLPISVIFGHARANVHRCLALDLIPIANSFHTEIATRGVHIFRKRNLNTYILIMHYHTYHII